MRALLLASLLALPLLAQSDGNSITVIVSQPLPLPPPDQLFSLSITVDPAKTDVPNLQRALLITGALQTRVNATADSMTVEFRLTVPASQVQTQDALIDLATLNLPLNVFETRTPVAPSAATIAEATRRAYPALLAEARTRAASSALAAGLTLGNVLAVSEVATPAATSAAIFARINSNSGTITVPYQQTPAVTTTTLAVKFAATRY